MRPVILLICTVMLLAAATAASQEADADQIAAMKAWEQAATPADQHAFFAKRAGRWSIEGNSWMAPDTDPIPSQSIGEARMILGGRYFVEELEGTSMGMPFEAMGILGFDNVTEMVTYVWYDNMGTVTTIMTGTYDRIGEPLELKGTWVDPLTKKALPFRSVTTFISDDESRFEYYSSMAPGMPEMKVMELTYTRLE